MSELLGDIHGGGNALLARGDDFVGVCTCAWETVPTTRSEAKVLLLRHLLDNGVDEARIRKWWPHLYA